MTKLNKQQQAEWQKHKDDLDLRRSDLESELEEYNSTMAAAWALMEKKIIDLNEKVKEADEWRSGVAEEMQNYFDERSEQWQEGDRGSSYQEWLGEWQNDLEEVELSTPDDVEMPDVNAIDTLEELPEEPSW